ncbi:MAG: amidohydrolase family protein [Lautropia sp.]
MHIAGPFSRFPLREVRTFQPDEATLEDYARTCQAIGVDRMVIVQPSVYGVDNACTLESVEASRRRARAVVVVDPAISDSEILEMHERGARGIRIQLYATGGLSLDVLQTLAERVKDLGWHIQLFLDAESLPDIAERLWNSPVPIVFDHMAHIQPGHDDNSPGFRILLELLKSGRAWVKLSNALFQPSKARARALIDCNPSQVLWGSDWPHIAYKSESPDDGKLVDQLFDWASDEAILRKILVDNPTRLYFEDRR